MQVRYRVHSAAPVQIAQTFETKDGRKIDALANGLCVELNEIDGDDTLTRRFVPEDMEAALALFAVGGVVVATLGAE
jgi:hypothetical protein